MNLRLGLFCLAFVCVTSCRDEPVVTSEISSRVDCSQPIVTPKSDAERLVLEDIRSKVSSHCRPNGGAYCGFKINATENSGHVVRVDYVFFEHMSNDCIQAGDGFEEYFYDSNGLFLRKESLGDQ
jgi:hypothetical protein